MQYAPCHVDLNNLAANVDIANAVPLTQKLGNFTDVLLEEEVPLPFAFESVALPGYFGIPQFAAILGQEDRSSSRMKFHALL
eukprot:scaffold72868_cov12-Tisochrysis_lutea.AAC.1